MDCKTKIINIVATAAGMDADELTMSSDLTEDCGIDKLDMAEVIMAIEDEFEIEFGDDTAEIRTIKDLVDIAKEKI